MKKFGFTTLALAGTLVTCTAHATLVSEKFTTDPALDGWQTFGDASLFHWNSTNENLEVTWDSSQINSYFYHPLGATFTKADGFCVQFDLTLADAVATGYFELAIGLCNIAQSTSPGFSRANTASPNLFEFDYFPPGPNSYGPSIDAVLADANTNFYFTFSTAQSLAANVTYHVVLLHLPGTSAISATVFTNGQLFVSLTDGQSYGANDFQLDALSINNYTTMDDVYGDSLLAHGVVDNLSFASPLPVGAVQAVAAGQVQLASDTNWLYTLEQSTDLKNWSPAAPPVPGNGTNLLLQATNAPTGTALYRVRAELP